MTKKELQQLIKEEITKQSFNEDTMKKEELQKLQEALTDVMKYQMDEPDHEGEMAKSQMLKTMKYAADIMNMIDDTTELPAWVQSKLTKIASYIGAVKHHMESKTVRHVVTNMMESEDIKLGDLLKKEPVNEESVEEGFSTAELNMVRRQVSNYAKKYVRGDFDQGINFMRGILDDLERERKKDKK